MNGEEARLTGFGRLGLTLRATCEVLEEFVRARWGSKGPVPPAVGAFDPPMNGRAVLDLVELRDDGRAAP